MGVQLMHDENGYPRQRLIDATGDLRERGTHSEFVRTSRYHRVADHTPLDAVSDVRSTIMESYPKFFTGLGFGNPHEINLKKDAVPFALSTFPYHLL